MIMETLADILDGVAPFPQPGDKVADSEWNDYADYGTVTFAYYPEVKITWDDGLISTEHVRY